MENLHDKRYHDFVQELVSSIPRYTSKWTNHNPADFGIALVELIAWLGDATLYRMDRVPGDVYLRFLQLLSGVPDMKTMIRIVSQPRDPDPSYLEFVRFTASQMGLLVPAQVRENKAIPGIHNLQKLVGKIEQDARILLSRKTKALWDEYREIETVQKQPNPPVRELELSLVYDLNRWLIQHDAMPKVTNVFYMTRDEFEKLVQEDSRVPEEIRYSILHALWGKVIVYNIEEDNWKDVANAWKIQKDQIQNKLRSLLKEQGHNLLPEVEAMEFEKGEANEEEWNSIQVDANPRITIQKDGQKYRPASQNTDGAKLFVDIKKVWKFTDVSQNPEFYLFEESAGGSEVAARVKYHRLCVRTWPDTESVISQNRRVLQEWYGEEIGPQTSWNLDDAKAAVLKFWKAICRAVTETDYEHLAARSLAWPCEKVHLFDLEAQEYAKDTNGNLSVSDSLKCRFQKEGHPLSTNCAVKVWVAKKHWFLLNTNGRVYEVRTPEQDKEEKKWEVWEDWNVRCWHILLTGDLIPPLGVVPYLIYISMLQKVKSDSIPLFQSDRFRYPIAIFIQKKDWDALYEKESPIPEELRHEIRQGVCGSLYLYDSDKPSDAEIKKALESEWNAPKTSHPPTLDFKQKEFSWEDKNEPRQKYVLSQEIVGRLTYYRLFVQKIGFQKQENFTVFATCTNHYLLVNKCEPYDTVEGKKEEKEVSQSWLYSLTIRWNDVYLHEVRPEIQKVEVSKGSQQNYESVKVTVTLEEGWQHTITADANIQKICKDKVEQYLLPRKILGSRLEVEIKNA